MALSDAACRTAKGRDGEYKLSDGGGLYLFVKPAAAQGEFRLHERQCGHDRRAVGANGQHRQA
ncbi:Arm DNA-binding domain-containing protein [Ancylobacter sp. A5.8]|uniref:Arm DNA-binding domain-containing protein n=1 Tax=Ancylobacter gelatini TaxID=2919920 RepID=UPI001F4E299D|nr:Arm DNA-binding domain-containing protein [Ancylobacter gelatini]MCJ8143197.1 Arm DNA-binding domain-containing protein [Ancylobacter gelatini]